MFKKSVVMICSGVLAGTLLVAAPSGAFADEKLSSSAVITPSVSTPIAEELFLERFEECPAMDAPAPRFSRLGENLGAGISEAVDAKMLAKINESRIVAGKPSLRKNVKAMRYFDSGRIVTLDGSGKIVEEIAAEYSADASAQKKYGDFIVATPSSALSEAARIIKACIGVGTDGALSIEAIIQMVATPKNAAKFVIRRLGWFGAISCAGGIIAEYI
ncbi:hypothetical protein [Glutamicibacter arilaitensis]|uniref:hypothetical protein n=1 Tax=Glutamicibacter arilaitensis TaxID=256701 RepID=UPI00384DD7F4